MYHGQLHLQIIAPRTGEAINFPAGEKAEADLQALCVAQIQPALIEQAKAAIAARGVGIFCTEKHVLRDIEDGLKSVLADVLATALYQAFEKFKAKTAGR